MIKTKIDGVILVMSESEFDYELMKELNQKHIQDLEQATLYCCKRIAEIIYESISENI